MDLDLDDQPVAPPAGRAGAKFKPKKNQLPLSTQTQSPLSPNNVSVCETIVPHNGTINQSTIATISKENVSGGVHGLHACTKLNSEGKRRADSMPDGPRPQDSATFRDFVTRETDEEEEEDWNMETLNIVQQEGITTAYDSRNDESNTNTTFYRELQEEEEEHNIPQVSRETIRGGCEDEHHVVSTNTKNTVIVEEEETLSGRESKKGKSKRARKRKTTGEEEPNKPPEKKKFKHSSRRQRNRTLEKELLETPDDEIRCLPIRDMLRLVDYRDWLEKKEAKGAPALPPTQESNTKASEDNQYYSQGFEAEDEFGLEDGENQETSVVKPDSPVNYQTYMNKTPRTRWSKQDTELFYEGIREFGSNLSMVQQLFPERTRQQMKLKFKSEERKFPLKLNEALSTRSKHLVHYHNVIKKLQQEAAAAREGEEGGEEAETTSVVMFPRMRRRQSLRESKNRRVEIWRMVLRNRRVEMNVRMMMIFGILIKVICKLYYDKQIVLFCPCLKLNL